MPTLGDVRELDCCICDKRTTHVFVERKQGEEWRLYLKCTKSYHSLYIKVGRSLRDNAFRGKAVREGAPA
jgi:hypothetical protein